MGISGKLVSKIVIKSDGDVFHEIFRERPFHISHISPDHIKSVDLHDGEWGKVGSILIWNYTHDGKECVGKEIIEAIDEEKKLVRFKVIEGDLLEVYETFVIACHVETKGEENLVTWTLEYEKKHEDTPDPNSLMEIWLAITKDMENHNLNSQQLKSGPGFACNESNET